MPDLRPLRHREYRLLVVGQSVSFLGSMVTYVAVPYQVFQLTDSSLAVGLVGVVQMVAILAPRLPRRGAGRLRRPAPPRPPGRDRPAPVLRRPSWPTPPSTARRSGRCSSCRRRSAGLGASSARPLRGIVPRLVERDELTAAGAIDALVRTVGMIAGPAFAGLLLAGPGSRWPSPSMPPPSPCRSSPSPACGPARHRPRRRAAEPAAGARGPALRPQPAGADRHLRDRLRGDVLRHALALFPALAERYGGRRPSVPSTPRRRWARSWPP